MPLIRLSISTTAVRGVRIRGLQQAYRLANGIRNARVVLKHLYRDGSCDVVIGGAVESALNMASCPLRWRTLGKVLPFGGTGFQ